MNLPNLNMGCDVVQPMEHYRSSGACDVRVFITCMMMISRVQKNDA